MQTHTMTKWRRCAHKAWMECWTDHTSVIMFSWENDGMIHVRRWTDEKPIGEQRYPIEYNLNDPRWKDLLSFAVPEKEECGEMVLDFRQMDIKIQTILQGRNES